MSEITQEERETWRIHAAPGGLSQISRLLDALEAVERERDHWRVQYEVAYAVAQNMADRLNEAETLGRALAQEGANDGDK